MTPTDGGASYRQLDADRWHFQHGPIDLIIDVDADAEMRRSAIAVCWQRFVEVLPALVTELPQLRRAIAAQLPTVSGPVAARMVHACAPFAHERFLTPMAAVAGAVADELIGVFDRAGIRRACINNGGDIALYLPAGAQYRVGIWSRLERLERLELSGCSGAALDGVFDLDHDSPVRGVATSGWRGRSFSLGIADSVTVLARNAAAADAAATLIANAVNGDFPGIVRTPAVEVKDDSDLGSLPVTRHVPLLSADAIDAALSNGQAEAESWQRRGAIHAAVLFLQGQVRVVMPVHAVERVAA